MVTEHGLEIQINNIISEPFLSKLIASYSVLIISVGLQSLPTIPRPWKNRMYGCIKSNGHLTDFLRGIINLARTTKVETMTQIRTLQEENKYILTLNVLPFSSIFISFSIQPLLFKGQFMCCPPWSRENPGPPRGRAGLCSPERSMKQSQRSFSSAGMIDMTARNELTQNLGWNIMVGPTKWLFNSFMRLFLDVIFHSPPDVLVCFGFHFFLGSASLHREEQMLRIC